MFDHSVIHYNSEAPTLLRHMSMILLLALVVALLFAEVGIVNAQQLVSTSSVARRQRQRRNVIAIADTTMTTALRSSSGTLSSTATATVRTPHYTSSSSETMRDNKKDAHFFNQDDLDYWQGMIRKTKEVMSMPTTFTGGKKEEYKHTSKATKMTKTEKKKKTYYPNPNAARDSYRNEEYHAMKKKKKEEEKKKEGEEGKW